MESAIKDGGVLRDGKIKRMLRAFSVLDGKVGKIVCLSDIWLR